MHTFKDMLYALQLEKRSAINEAVGQGGRDYEVKVNDKLKKHGRADPDSKTAGSSADAPDATSSR